MPHGMVISNMNLTPFAAVLAQRVARSFDLIFSGWSLLKLTLVLWLWKNEARHSPAPMTLCATLQLL